MSNIDLSKILTFLPSRTIESWIDAAKQPENLAILLIDHANNELKAAQSAMSLINRYRNNLMQKSNLANGNWHKLMQKMSRLAREEMRHFEQVLTILQKNKIIYYKLPAGKYARSLQAEIRSNEPEKLIDSLIIGAYIEARSCERFAVLAPWVNDNLQKFYLQLLKSESRHFEVYLDFARKFSKSCINNRISFFAELEHSLVTAKDSCFRFHSGCPN